MADPKDATANKGSKEAQEKKEPLKLPAPANEPPKELEAPKDTVVVSGEHLNVKVDSSAPTQVEPQKKAEPVVGADGSPKNGRTRAEKKKAVDGLKDAIKEVAKTPDVVPPANPPVAAVATASAPPAPPVIPPASPIIPPLPVMRSRIFEAVAVIVIIVLVIVAVKALYDAREKAPVAKKELVSDPANPYTLTPVAIIPQDDPRWAESARRFAALEEKLQKTEAQKDIIVGQRDQFKADAAVAVKANADAAARLEQVNQVSDSLRLQKNEIDKESLELLKD